MKRVVALVVILSVVLFGLSIGVHAAKLKETDTSKPQWGFDFKVGLNDDGSLRTDEAQYSAWWRISRDHNRWQKRITGRYTDPGPTVTTIIGTKLGATYSPYGAWFQRDADDINIRGIRVMNYPVNIVGNTFTFDGVFVVPSVTNDIGGSKDSPMFDLGLNVKGKVSIVDLHMAFARDGVEVQDGGKKDYKANWAYILEPTVNITKDIKVAALYAGYRKYNETEDAFGTTSLWKVDAEWKIVGDSVKVRAGVRDSDADFRPKYTDMDDGVGSTNVLFDQRQKGKGFSVGTTVKFQPIADMIMTFDADYDSNVDRAINESGIVLGLKTTYKKYSVDQTLSLPKVQVTSGRADKRLHDIGYTLRAKTPTYDLPYNIKLFAGFDNDTDIDDKDLVNMWNRLYVRADKQLDLPYFPRVKTSAIVLYENELKNGKDVAFRAPVKAALQAEYTAPNGVKFTAQYLTSNDLNGSRYNPYKFYEDDTGGFRFQITFSSAW